MSLKCIGTKFMIPELFDIVMKYIPLVNIIICVTHGCQNNASAFKIGNDICDSLCFDCMKIKYPDITIMDDMQYVIKFDCMKESKIIYTSSMQHIVDMFNNEIQCNTQKKMQMLKKINKMSAHTYINVNESQKEEYSEFIYLDTYITKYYELCKDARRQILT